MQDGLQGRGEGASPHPAEHVCASVGELKGPAAPSPYPLGLRTTDTVAAVAAGDLIGRGDCDIFVAVKSDTCRGSLRVLIDRLCGVSPRRGGVGEGHGALLDPPAEDLDAESAGLDHGVGLGQGARLFEGACAVCHEPGVRPSMFNAGPHLGLNTNLHLDRPDNFLRVILHGIQNSAHGAMPGFSKAFDDQQIVDLARYARERFAPGKAPWANLEESVRRLRAAH